MQQRRVARGDAEDRDTETPDSTNLRATYPRNFTLDLAGFNGSGFYLKHCSNSLLQVVLQTADLVIAHTGFSVGS